MPLQTGTWSINVRGQIGLLTIKSVAAEGDVQASLDLPGTIEQSAVGWWDDDSQKLVLAAPVDLNTFQELIIFTGFLFQDPNRLLIRIQGAITYTLVGYVVTMQNEMAALPEATAEKHTFGWYAQIGVG